jgi:hypothetical protein
MAFISVGIFSGLGSWTIVGAGPAVVVVMEEFNISLSATLDGLINWCILLIGIGVCRLMNPADEEFHLGPLWAVFRNTPDFSRRLPFVVWHDDLVRCLIQLDEFSCRPNCGRICYQLWRSFTGYCCKRSLLSPRARLVDGNIHVFLPSSLFAWSDRIWVSDYREWMALALLGVSQVEGD